MENVRRWRPVPEIASLLLILAIYTIFSLNQKIQIYSRNIPGNERDPVGVENGLVVSLSTLRIGSIWGSEAKVDLENVQYAYI